MSHPIVRKELRSGLLLCLSYRFDVVGAANQADAASLKPMAGLKAMPNVTWHGSIPHRRIGAHFEQGAVLVLHEPVGGLSNTFLEAWSRGVPVVSTITTP
jgi:hypothetical protein